MIKLNFQEPLPNNQQIPCLHGFKQLGFKAEREFSSGEFILWKFSGRLPTITGSSNVDILFTDQNLSDFKTITNIDYIEFYLMFERKN